ncbi:shikimate dehydrogenase [uncultured Maritalea sp.]|uniref:shikimate dehydrogenase n=1 Tax=uncultured Maritalea sp. TaxID=757249 RepID=UPI0026205B73|nr:shikimate dehydrogenase [uncultured Maritalea sp.]
MKRAFVIGHPISHSKSPILHGHWLDELNIDGTYVAIDVAPIDLPEFVDQIKSGSFIGGNVTVPHKEAVMTLCDKITATAEKIGAVNTLWLEDGRLIGDNTDKYGFLANLDQRLADWDKEIQNAIVLGAGGAARAVLVGLAERGFQSIRVLNRTSDRAQSLCNALNKVFENKPFVASLLSDFNKLAPHADLIVNTSAVGMGGTKFQDLDLSLAQTHTIVTDIVYTPLETPLLADARQAGLRTVDGVGMLLHQAVPGFERWFGARPTVSSTLREKILGAQS